MRGYLTRKHIKAIRGGQGFGKSMMNHFDFTGPANFDNQDVQVRFILVKEYIFTIHLQKIR